MASFESPNSALKSPSSSSSAEQDLRLRFAGKWVKVKDDGFRALLVWLGVPWLLSFVAVRKTVNFQVSFEDNDASEAGTMIVDGDERIERIPLNGDFIDSTMTTPFVRTVQCNASWKDGEACTMVMKRIDHTVGKNKPYPTEATITRRISPDGNTIVSTLSILRLSDNTTKEATLFLARQ